MNNIDVYGILNSKVYYNLSVKELYKITIHKKQGILTNNDVLCVKTGVFTGRSPKDRYIVRDKITSENVWWGDINIPIDQTIFDSLYKQITDHLSNKELYVNEENVPIWITYRIDNLLDNKNILEKCLWKFEKKIVGGSNRLSNKNDNCIIS